MHNSNLAQAFFFDGEKTQGGVLYLQEHFVIEKFGADDFGGVQYQLRTLSGQHLGILHKTERIFAQTRWNQKTWLQNEEEGIRFVLDHYMGRGYVWNHHVLSEKERENQRCHFACLEADRIAKLLSP